MNNTVAPAEGQDPPEEGGIAGTDDDLLHQLQSWFKDSRDFSDDWRIEARECYDFVAGHQYNEEEAAFLRQSLRPIITFNRVAPVVDNVAGLEVANRQEVQFIPRQVGNAGVNELLTEAARWVRDECDADDEESDAFRDSVICGMGWTETRVDYEDDPDGQILVDRVDPLEMFWDGSSRKKNIADSRFLFRVRDLPVSDAEQRFPGVDLEDLHASWAEDFDSAQQPHDATEAPFYRIDQAPEIDRMRQKVRIVEAQWWDLETVAALSDPTTGKILRIPVSQAKKLSDRVQILTGAPLPFVEQRHKVYKRAWIGARIIKQQAGAKSGFTYKAITAKRDRNKNIFYGIVRAMMDPQRWANKWLSQTLHIINSNAKGGLLAEADAFDNQAEAEDSWAQPDSITFTAPGALRGGKIQPKNPPPLPQGMQPLLEFAIGSIRDVSGVNLELLGLTEKNQPGIVENARKQAGMTVLAGLFDALKRYRKNQGRLLLEFITEYISDGRLIRIGDAAEAQYVPLVRLPDTIKFDVIVDDAPTSPNLKEQTWDAIMQLLPMLMQAGLPPSAGLTLLKYSPLPQALVADLEQSIAKAQSTPNPMMMATVQEKQASANLHNAQAQRTMAEASGQSQAGQAEVTAQALKTRATMVNAQADLLRSTVQAQAAMHDAALRAAQPNLGPFPAR